MAKWLKSNVPTKKTKFLNHNVEYFSAVRAIDALLASKFAQGDNCLFPHRQAVIDFMDEMLHHKLFHRARKVAVSEQELRGKSKKGSEKEKDQPKGAKDDKTTDGGESSHAEGKGGAAADKDKEKRKRKIRLEMHPEQLFVDGHEAYVWLYDPIPMHYWIFGALLVVGAIVICLFPLWPPLLRKGVYYLSIAAAGFLVFILGLAVLRFVIFCLVWIVTGGKHHFWLLPNLTEDVGFFASFWPLYDVSKKKKLDSSEQLLLINLISSSTNTRTAARTRTRARRRKSKSATRTATPRTRARRRTFRPRLTRAKRKTRPRSPPTRKASCATDERAREKSRKRPAMSRRRRTARTTKSE